MKLLKTSVNICILQIYCKKLNKQRDWRGSIEWIMVPVKKTVQYYGQENSIILYIWNGLKSDFLHFNKNTMETISKGRDTHLSQRFKYTNLWFMKVWPSIIDFLVRVLVVIYCWVYWITSPNCITHALFPENSNLMRFHEGCGVYRLFALHTVYIYSNIETFSSDQVF